MMVCLFRISSKARARARAREPTPHATPSKVNEIHKKIMKALIQVYGEEEANKINEEWIGCSSEIEIENEIVIFKEALYLGYDLADVFFNRR